VDAVGHHGEPGPGLDGGGMAGRREQDEGGGGEQQRLSAHREPVDACRQRAGRRQEGGEEEQQAVTGEPDVSGRGLERHPDQRGGAHRGRQAILGQRGLPAQRHHAGHERRHHDPSRTADDGGFPPPGRHPLRRPGQHDHGDGADGQERGREVRPADSDAEAAGEVVIHGLVP
jgi:hypothetical protein